MASNPTEVRQMLELELNRARAKHKVWPVDDIHRGMIIMDQAGSVAKECFKVIYGGGSEEYLRRKILHLAVVCIRWLEGG